MNTITPMTKPQLDPYLIWAILSDWKYFRAGSRQVSVVIECTKSLQDFYAEIGKPDFLPWLRIPSIYTDSTVLKEYGLQSLKYCSATVSGDKKNSTVLVERLLWLAARYSVKRIKLSAAVSEPGPKGFGALQIKPPQTRDEVYVGVVDDFIAFRRPEFCDAKGKCRYLAIWNQSPRRFSDDWRAPIEMGYGSAIAPAAGNQNLRKDYPFPLKAYSHGTAVASVAHSNSKLAARPTSASAAQSPITGYLGVFLPESTVEDTSGGAMSAQLLDALMFLTYQAGKDNYLVANVSYGTHAGTHDGSSIVEKAIDQLSALRDGKLTVVLPTGNQREAKGHANFTLANGIREQALAWHILPDDATPNFLEIWLDRDDFGLVDIALFSPGGKNFPVAVVKQAPKQMVAGAKSSKDAAFAIGVRDSALGENRSCFLLAVNSTRISPQVEVAEHGVWTVTVGLKRNVNKTMVIDAYIERNDTLFNARKKGRQSRFVDPHYLAPGRSYEEPWDSPAAYVKRAGSTNSFSSGVHSIKVAGYVASGLLKSAAYSGMGPLWGPVSPAVDVAAPSEQSTALRGFRVAGTTGSHVFRINGTSVAAPIVTRQLAEAIAAEVAPKGPPNLVEVRNLLGQLAKGPNSHQGDYPDPEQFGLGRLVV